MIFQEYLPLDRLALMAMLARSFASVSETPKFIGPKKYLFQLFPQITGVQETEKQSRPFAEFFLSSYFSACSNFMFTNH